jgi:hypothetical protein
LSALRLADAANENTEQIAVSGEMEPLIKDDIVCKQVLKPI